MLYVRDCYDCFEHKCSEDSVECLCVRIRGKANRADVVVGVYYRPLSHPAQMRETSDSDLQIPNRADNGETSLKVQTFINYPQCTN